MAAGELKKTKQKLKYDTRKKYYLFAFAENSFTFIAFHFHFKYLINNLDIISDEKGPII